MQSKTIHDPFDDDAADAVAATFKPTPLPKEEPTTPAQKSAIKAADDVAEKQGFSARRPARRKSSFRRSDNFRTGRNEFIGIKATAEAKDQLAKMTDQRKWVNGQTLQYALDALQEKIENPEDDFWKTHNFHGVD